MTLRNVVKRLRCKRLSNNHCPRMPKSKLITASSMILLLRWLRLHPEDNHQGKLFITK